MSTIEPQPQMIRIDGILTTTDAVPAYGGIRLSLSILQALADKTNRGELPITWNHDARRPVRVANVAAGVRRRGDGEFEAWVSYDVDETEWARFRAECEALSAPGGFSFTMGVPIEIDGTSEDDRPALVKLAADAAHYSSDDLRAAAAGSSDVRVQPQELFQFGAEPLARVIIDLLPGFLIAIPPNVVSNYLYDLLRRFVPSRSGSPSIFEIRITETPERISKTLYLETSDRKTLRRAINRFGEALETDSPLVEIDTNENESEYGNGSATT